MLKELVMLGVKTERLLTNWEQIQHLAPEARRAKVERGEARQGACCWAWWEGGECNQVNEGERCV